MAKREIGKIKKLAVLDGICVHEAVQDYLQSAHVKALEARTREEYVYELGVFASWCSAHAIHQDKKSKVWIAVDASEDESIMLHQVDSQVVHLFVEHVKTTHTPRKAGHGMSSYTLQGYVRVIKGFLNWCLMDQEYSKQIQALTIKRIEMPVVVEAIIQPFSPIDIKLLFAACQKEESEHLQLRDEAILAVLLDTGLRAQELVTLTIGNVSTDPRDAYVKVLGKGKKWGEVGMGERARKSVAKYIRLFREPTIKSELGDLPPARVKQEILSHTVFMNRYGQRMTPSGLYQIFARLGEWAGIEGVRCSPHDCRHTFSVNFIRQGGDIYTLSKLLRHSSVKVTEEYLKSLHQSEARRGAKSVLDNL